MRKARLSPASRSKTLKLVKTGAHSSTRSSRRKKALTKSLIHTLAHDNPRSFFPSAASSPAPYRKSAVLPPSSLNESTNPIRAGNERRMPFSTTRSSRRKKALTKSLIHTLTHDNSRSFFPSAASSPAPYRKSAVLPPSSLNEPTNPIKAGNPRRTLLSTTCSNRSAEALTRSPFHTLTHDKLRSHTLFFPNAASDPPKSAAVNQPPTTNAHDPPRPRKMKFELFLCSRFSMLSPYR